MNIRARQPRGVRYAAIRGAWAAERDAERNRLLREIESAFDGVRLGNGVSLHQARALDCHEADDIVAAARALDTETDWREIPDEKVDDFDFGFSFLDAEGFRFYIPRFMIRSLQQGDCGIAATSANQPPTSPQFQLLAPQQRRVLQGFVRFFEDLSRSPT